MAKPQVNVKPIQKGTSVITGCVRLAFQSLIEPRASNLEGSIGELKYPAVVLLEPDCDTLPALKAAMKAAAEEYFGADKIPSGLKNPIRDGAEKQDDYPFYAGHKFINVSTKTKPGVVDQRNKPITDPDELYSGCWVRLELNAFGYNKKGNKGVSFAVNNVQKLGDDERFGGRKPPEQVFTPVVDTATAFGKAAEDDSDTSMFE